MKSYNEWREEQYINQLLEQNPYTRAGSARALRTGQLEASPMAGKLQDAIYNSVRQLSSANPQKLKSFLIRLNHLIDTDKELGGDLALKNITGAISQMKQQVEKEKEQQQQQQQQQGQQQGQQQAATQQQALVQQQATQPAASDDFELAV